MIFQLSKRGVDLIKHFEGFRASMYLDSVGKPTIGYGTLIDTKEEEYLMTATITEAAAEVLLRRDVQIVEANVNRFVTSKINQNQFDSLVSFAYNLGVVRLAKSTLLKKVNSNPADATIRNEFWKWCFAGGKVSEGLLKRRKDEATLYFLAE